MNYGIKKRKIMNQTAIKFFIIALVAMFILFNIPLIIGFFIMIFIMIVKLTWNLLWIIAIVGIAVAFILKK
jgi:hypothetical protein